MKMVAVIPAYNEASRVYRAIQDAKPHVDAVVVVDDCSHDATFEEALRAGAYVLRHEINRGQGAALQTGTEHAIHELGAEIVVHFDADGQMQGKDIPALTEPIRNGEAKVVLGSRFLGKESNMPFSRRIILKLVFWFTWIVSGIRISDPHCGFRALSHEAALDVKITLDRMAHASEILDLVHRKRIIFVERPVEILYTAETLQKGQSFISGFAVLRDIFKSKFFDRL